MTASVLPSPTAGSAAETSSPRGRNRKRRFVVVPATPGDHASVCQFLTAVFQGRSPAEFRASLEDPHFRPHDRLLIKRDSEVVAHAHVARRVMRFGPLRLPVAGLDWLGTLPMFREQGHGHRLLTAAEEHMASAGALVGLTWTRIPHFFRRTGWALCGRRFFSRAGARDAISGLMAQGLLRRGRKHLNIRPWRRVELGALVRIYNQSLDGKFGAFERTEAYWKWLISRHGYDQIFVALDGPDLLELEETLAPIVGYAVTCGERIVELLTAPGHRTAAAQLLARACRDAIEHGRHTVWLDAPPNSRADKLFRVANGKRQCDETDPPLVLMAKLLSPVKLLRAMAGELHRRAETAGLARPIELGMLVDGQKFRLAITPDRVEVVDRNIGRSYLRLNVADFTRLLLGHLDWDKALADGRVEPSTNIALVASRALFPKLPLWLPPLDNLPAKE
ncbi:MAG: GNAT family N-acetyltransferase [Planctomycetes bacterium]|nr:GNAT family N-acetyltransferase [Planctomycetota bacterium]